ncbi:fructose-2,6-bisphosphatase TIGAR-like [Diadema antillarum]|uniref:fructose-2,6-bisphosphatase TIGAR-like n=1 Tax=Diadema antillarum TaxID=105358 RepID=UPI003A840C08
MRYFRAPRKMGKFMLTFVRHGETEYNKQGLLQGQTDIPLNETGFQQAAALGRYLTREPFTRIYSSDLSRCVQTAEGVIKNGKVPRPGIIKDARLRERYFGSFEGATRNKYRQAQATSPNSSLSGVETASQVVDRGLSFLNDLCKELHQEFEQNREREEICVTTGSLLSREEDEGVSHSQFEVVFAAEGDSGPKGTVNSDSDSTTPISGSGTTAMSASASSTVDARSHAAQETAGQEDRMDTIFVSGITGVRSAPLDCPHILVSSHGFMLRALFQKLQKLFRMDIPGGPGLLRTGCPNTGLSTFVVELDSKGSICDMECYFVFLNDHLSHDDLQS